MVSGKSHLIQSVLCGVVFLSQLTVAQVMTIPTTGFSDIGVHGLGGGLQLGLDLISSQQMVNNLYGMMTNIKNRPLGEASSTTVSRLDLRAPRGARHEYEKGYQLLLHKDYPAAIVHLLKSTGIYPQFVAAHSALGSAYLGLGQNDNARQEFSEAAKLDDLLPNSHLNLGVAQLALKDYAGATESFKKASSIAPLDLSLLRALAYGQFVNKDYAAVIATAEKVHKQQHEGTAIVHYLAAGAWYEQGNLVQAQRELETVIQEAPSSEVATQARQVVQQVKAEITKVERPRAPQAEPSPTFVFEPAKQPTSEEARLQAQKIIQDLKGNKEIAEAEAAEGQLSCENCNQPPAAVASVARTPNTESSAFASGGVVRSRVDEVAVFFAVTDRGKSVTDLASSDITIQDSRQPPAAILAFRNEAELPLRLGLVIDTSDSVAKRFSFEQHAASNFLQKLMIGKDDQAFVVGVNNLVLLVQDFTADQSELSHAIEHLVPTSGTALWDAVEFAADKLAGYPETHPVARVLVVISDGENNSSTVTLKEAIARAQNGEVTVYTVSTSDYDTDVQAPRVGDHALRTLSQLTGGVAFAPGSVRRLNGSLDDLQQVLRGRYLVAYKPASFQRDGAYRPIEITARKNGRKLNVYARKGYYARADGPSTPAP